MAQSEITELDLECQRRELARREAYADIAQEFAYMFKRTRGGEDFFRYNPSIGEGWTPIFKRLCAQIDEVLPTDAKRRFRLVQVKQKFGGLRVYFRFVGKKTRLWVVVQFPQGLVGTFKPQAAGDLERQVQDLIDVAAGEAANTCETCGRQPAEIDGTGGWLVTLCEEHRALRRADDLDEGELQ